MQQTPVRDDHRNKIILALRSIRDVGETLQRGDSGGKFVPGSRLMMMPAAWHTGCPPDCVGRGGDNPRACRSTYARLLLALDVLRDRWPTHHWHLSRRYLESERLTHELVRAQDGRHVVYYEAVRSVRWEGEHRSVRYAVGDRLPANVEVLAFQRDLRAPLSRRPGVPASAVPVWASIERWHPRVLPVLVRESVDGLARLLPGELRLPKELAA